MSDSPIVPTAEPAGRGAWLDAYMPESGYLAPAPRQQFFNFSAVRGILYRQRWLVAGAVAFALICGVVITLLTVPTYQAYAKVAIKPSGQYIIESESVDQGFSPNQIYDFMATQTEIIRSRSMAEQVVDDLDLAARTDLLGKEIEESRPKGISDAQWKKQKRQMAASVLAGSVRADVPTNNWVISIGFVSERPDLAAEIANGYADAFVASGSRNSTQSNRYALEYLRQQIEDVRTRLAQSEQSANAYARSTGIIVQPTGDEAGTSTTLTGSNLTSINARAAEAKAVRIEAEQRWRAIQNLPASQLREVQGSPVLQAAVAERSSRLAQLADLRQRYNDEFPQIQNLLAQVAELDRQIERSGNEVKAAARSDYLVALKQEQALEAELGSLASERLVEQDRQVELSVLEREAQAARNELESLLNRYNQINSAATLDNGLITKIDSAIVPGAPFAPNLYKNLGLALVFGIALAGALAVLRETFDDRIRSLDDVEDKLGLSLLGHTPHVEHSDIDVIGNDRFSSLMEAYSSVRAAIDFSLPRNRNVIQFTSSQPSEGKSTTAVILAELAAGLGRKTLLIDADLRRPSVAKLLGIEKPKVGFVEVLLGHVELQDAVVPGSNENLDILPIGEIPPNPTELMSSPALRSLIERYRKDYSLIIFDSCPVMGLADAPLLANLVDGTVFILEANRVPFGQARTAVRRLTMAGGKMIGVVLTKYKALDAGQSQNYQYGYYEYGRDTK